MTLRFAAAYTARADAIVTGALVRGLADGRPEAAPARVPAPAPRAALPGLPSAGPLGGHAIADMYRTPTCAKRFSGSF